MNKKRLVKLTNLLWALTDWSRFAPNTYTLRGIKAQTY